MTLGLLCGTPHQPDENDNYTMRVPRSVKVKADARSQNEVVKSLRRIPAIPHSGTYATGKLAGSAVSDLYAAYLGYKGTIPKTLTVDWNLQLRSLWDRKAKISSAAIVKVTGKMLVAEYERLDPERMSIAQYQALAGRQSALVYNSLNWDQVGKFYFFDKKTKTVNARKLALLKRVSKNIDGRTLVAYSMTELFPSAGNYSYEYLDFLLRNAGLRYVESLPALHDPLTSFGSYQFTSLAVNDNENSMGGASVVNRSLPRSVQIPSSVSLLRGNYHPRAATLFAISNIAMLIRKLDSKRLAEFERIVDSRSIELAQFIATAHNKPNVAYKAGKKWLDANARSSYQAGCPKVSRLYANKTQKNYASLTIAMR